MRTEKENRNTKGNRNDKKGIEKQRRHERNRATDKIMLHTTHTLKLIEIQRDASD